MRREVLDGILSIGRDTGRFTDIGGVFETAEAGFEAEFDTPLVGAGGGDGTTEAGFLPAAIFMSSLYESGFFVAAGNIVLLFALKPFGVDHDVSCAFGIEGLADEGTDRTFSISDSLTDVT